MWALRVLSGPQAGEIFELRSGRNLIGRAQTCDIKLQSAGISKEHAEIHITGEKISLFDLNSSNGTFINGTRTSKTLVKVGDKVGVHDVIIDVIKAPKFKKAMSPVEHAQPTATHAPMGSHPNYSQPMGDMGVPNSMHGIPNSSSANIPPSIPASGFAGFMEKVNHYLETVALPGVYKLPQLLEFKMVLLGFIALFIFSTTMLSMIPMVAVTRASIISESKRRAQSIARTLATINQGNLMQGSYTSLNTNAAETEEGVKQVYIVQQSDGMILAPASRAGSTPDMPFVHTARRELRPQAVEVDSTTIGASFPIGLYDANTGEQMVKAHAIVLYDVGALAFDDGHVLSLFMQTLVLASIFGLIIFYFMYKLIEYPIATLNRQLDEALREKKDSTGVDFIFPPLQALVGNINSLLTRYMQGHTDNSASSQVVNKEGEAENIVQVIGYPAIAINKDQKIILANSAFGQLTRLEPAVLSNSNMQAIGDNAVIQNFQGLMAKAFENSRAIHSDNLEFSGHPCVISCQAVSSNSGIEYYLLTIAPAEGGG